MVTTELRINQEPKEEVDVWVVTLGCIRIGINLEHGEMFGHNIEGEIRKVSQEWPKFDAA
jgi:hypothetical protein